MERAKNLIAECRFLGTAFLNKTEEFAHLFGCMNSCLSLVNNNTKYICNGDSSVEKDLEKMEQLLKDIVPANEILTDARNKDEVLAKDYLFPFLLSGSLNMSSLSSPFNITDLIIDYEEFLGKGTSCMVYKGKLFGIPVAAKVFKRLGNVSYEIKFQELKNKTRHPHMLQMFGWCQKEHSIYCVTELMDTDVKKFIRRKRLSDETKTARPFAEMSAIDIMLQIANAMSYLHGQDITHGSLALSNILLNVNSSVLGPRHYFSVKVAGLLSSKSDNIALGYMAPEMFDHAAGAKPDKKVDIYAFGVICAEILTGQEFFDEKNIFKFGMLVKQGKRPDLGTSKSLEELLKLIQDCWDENPGKRPDFSKICNVLEELKRISYSRCSSFFYKDNKSSDPAHTYEIAVVDRPNTCSSGSNIFQPTNIVVEGPFQNSWEDASKILENLVRKAKINVHQSKLLYDRCKQLLPAMTDTKSRYQMWELGNILHRCILLVGECKHVETAFLDKTAEFEYILKKINSFHSYLEKLDLEFQEAVDQDLMELLKKTTAVADKELTCNVIAAIAKKGLLNGNQLKAYWEDRLGRGSYGGVYRGKLFGMDVAIKQFQENDDIIHKIECEMMGEVARSHPHLLQMLGYLKEKDVVQCVAELMNTDLEKLIKEKGERPFPLITAIEVMSQIAEAMSYLHNRGIIHRDLKLSNILVNSRRPSLYYLVIKVADFGEARIALRETSNMTACKGTPSYMAPEIMSEAFEAQYNKKVDVYSFAIMCAEILTGKKFGRRCSMADWSKEIQSGTRPILPEECPSSLQLLIQDCWNLNPKRRPDFDHICSALMELKKGLLN